NLDPKNFNDFTLPESTGRRECFVPSGYFFLLDIKALFEGIGIYPVPTHVREQQNRIVSIGNQMIKLHTKLSTNSLTRTRFINF
uniref:hypothetical protein n=1 Tax=Proteus faecis TaxID=2050967 RepID=UPI003075CDBA